MGQRVQVRRDVYGNGIGRFSVSMTGWSSTDRENVIAALDGGGYRQVAEESGRLVISAAGVGGAMMKDTESRAAADERALVLQELINRVLDPT